MEKNLHLPGNLRYQPKQLMDIFGYDNLYQPYIEVEMATLETLYDFGVIPHKDWITINESVKRALKDITTSEVDKIERTVTKHDIRALVQIMQKIAGPQVSRWLHVPLTSYDPIETARALQFTRAFKLSLEPSIKNLFIEMVNKIYDTYDIEQIGRTHGQHALPITVGFWLATILQRMFHNYLEMKRFNELLVGKISGAVGAYNAQVGLNLTRGEQNFERAVLKKLGILPAKISTQILPPEPLAYFLFSCTMMSASLAQFGRDGRNLMRTEIGEIAEEFSTNQVGSSTMAHKRNPINFENTEGMWLRTKNEFGKVLDTLISEHQRDLVGSCVARDFPIIIVNLQQQLNTLLRTDSQDRTFLSKISINKENCQKNLQHSAGLVIAEPLYIALQIAGYKGDAHSLVNKVL
ncbi:MAG TPA: lyase family protein, partial [Patescibacteria group bacterium]|nr:lyase family protein [Patescibacteria group bacterium]